MINAGIITDTHFNIFFFESRHEIHFLKTFVNNNQVFVA